MKKIILTTAILLATVFGINTSTYAAAANKGEVSTVLTNVNKFNKIEVYGNVELYLSDGETDQVKVYNHYYKESALVQDQNGVLRISSYKAQKLVVWITVSDLRSLLVYDNADVRSFGKVSAIDLDIKLFNNATVQLNLDAFQANITLNDFAKANLTGNIEQGEVKYDPTVYLNVNNLVSAHLIKTEKSSIGEKNDLSEL